MYFIDNHIHQNIGKYKINNIRFFVGKSQKKRDFQEKNFLNNTRKNIYTADCITTFLRLVFNINLRNCFNGIDIYSLSKFACNSAWYTFIYSKCHKE